MTIPITNYRSTRFWARRLACKGICRVALPVRMQQVKWDATFVHENSTAGVRALLSRRGREIFEKLNE